jgi:hypothetical protein
LSFFDDPAVGAAAPICLRPRRARLYDGVFDIALRIKARLAKARILRGRGPPRSVLIVGVEAPGREAELARVMARLAESRHAVCISTAAMGERGKFANVEAAISAAPQPLERYDWLVIADDDIAFRGPFLDTLIDLSELTGLTLAQPAHGFGSFASYAVTRRHWFTLVRQTRFVEIGPLTAIHSRAFSELVPFPPSRWGWGIDACWSAIAARNGWRLGVVDAAPLRHLRPVAATYEQGRAIAEGRELLRAEAVTASRAESLRQGTSLL